MFKSFQDTSALQQFHGFPNLNMQQATSAYGFSGVTFWLDAAYGLNTQTNLGAVSRWQQRVGEGRFIQDTVSAQMRLVLNDSNFNNLPSVECNAINKWMTADNGLRLNISGFTIAVVSKVNTDRQINALLFSLDGSNYMFDGGSGTNRNGFGFISDSITRLQGSTESLNPRIKIITGTNVIVNGVSETTTGAIGTTSIELKVLFAQISGPGSATVSYTGTIAEIIAFPYTMTSDEAIALSNNLNQKYAIY